MFLMHSTEQAPDILEIYEIETVDSQNANGNGNVILLMMIIILLMMLSFKF